MTRQVRIVVIAAVVIAVAFMTVFLGGNTVIMLMSRTRVHELGRRRGRAKQMRHRCGNALNRHHQQQREYQYLVDESEHGSDSRVKQVSFATFLSGDTDRPGKFALACGYGNISQARRGAATQDTIVMACMH